MNTWASSHMTKYNTCFHAPCRLLAWLSNTILFAMAWKSARWSINFVLPCLGLLLVFWYVPGQFISVLFYNSGWSSIIRSALPQVSPATSDQLTFNEHEWCPPLACPGNQVCCAIFICSVWQAYKNDTWHSGVWSDSWVDPNAVTISLSYHHTDYFFISTQLACFLHHFSLS